jgi:hypothetical protein
MSERYHQAITLLSWCVLIAVRPALPIQHKLVTYIKRMPLRLYSSWYLIASVGDFSYSAVNENERVQSLQISSDVISSCPEMSLLIFYNWKHLVNISFLNEKDFCQYFCYVTQNPFFLRNSDDQTYCDLFQVFIQNVYRQFSVNMESRSAANGRSARVNRAIFDCTCIDTRDSSRFRSLSLAATHWHQPTSHSTNPCGFPEETLWCAKLANTWAAAGEWGKGTETQTRKKTRKM